MPRHRGPFDFDVHDEDHDELRCALCAGPSIILSWLVIVIVLLLCSGCFQQERQRDLTTTVRRSYTESGTSGGVPFVKQGVEETTTTTAEKTTTTTGLDPATSAAIQSAIAGAINGATAGTPVGSVLALFGGGSGVAAIGAAALQTIAKRKREKDQAEKDAAWEAERESAIAAAQAQSRAEVLVATHPAKPDLPALTPIAGT